MSFHLYVCTANGMVKTEQGLVPFTEFQETMKKKGVDLTAATPFVLNPKHNNCDLICPDPTKCQRATTV